MLACKRILWNRPNFMYDRIGFHRQFEIGFAMRDWILSTVLAIAWVSRSGAADSPDFTRDVVPVLTKYCTGCHNDTDREGKLSLQSYEAILKGGAKGGVVTPEQPELSRIVRVLTGAAKPAMPPEGEEAPKPAEIDVLKNWISAGAKGPS